LERETLPPPRLRIDLRITPCRTVLAYAGLYQLTLESTAPDLAVELHSYYLGQRQAGYVATSHLSRIAGQGARVFCAPAGSEEVAVGERRRDCLVDHLDQLSVLIAGHTGGAVVIDVSEEALARMDATSPLKPG
jgi:hypothetical protein